MQDKCVLYNPRYEFKLVYHSSVKLAHTPITTLSHQSFTSGWVELPSGFGWKGPKDLNIHLVPTSLPWAWIPFTRSGCSIPYPVSVEKEITGDFSPGKSQLY